MQLKSAYKQTLLGTIPQDWETLSVFDIADRQKARFDDGDWVEAEHIAKNGIRLVQTGNIGIGIYVEKENKKYISNASFELLRCKPLEVGDLLICRLAEPAGRACILPNIGDESVITSVDVTIFRPDIERFDRGYLVQYFSTRSWFASILERVGGTTHKRIARSALGNIQIPVPVKKAEQSAIANALGDMDALLAAQDALIEKKRAVRRGAMQELLTGVRRLPGFYEEWKLKRFGDIAPLQRGFDLPTSTLRSGDYPVVYSNGVLNSHASYQVEGPGVVTGRSGTIGNVTYVDGRYWPHNTALWVTSFEGNDPRFVFYLYQHVGLERFATGSGVPTLNRNDVHAFKVLIPPTKEEQTHIAGLLLDMDIEISSLEAKRKKIAQLKQGMMQELLTGKIRLA